MQLLLEAPCVEVAPAMFDYYLIELTRLDAFAAYTAVLRSLSFRLLFWFLLHGINPPALSLRQS